MRRAGLIAAVGLYALAVGSILAAFPATAQPVPRGSGREHLHSHQLRTSLPIHQTRTGADESDPINFLRRQSHRSIRVPGLFGKSSDSLRILRHSVFNSAAGPSEEEPSAIATDDSGNTYITGMGTLIPNGCGYLTLKVDRQGRLQWVARYNNQTSMSSHFAAGIVVDRHGNCIVTGTSEGPSGTDDIATVKYSPEGTQIWAARHEVSSGGSSAAVGLAIDDAGFIYIAGSSDNRNHSTDLLILKYDPDGTLIWSTAYDNPDHLDDIATAMAIAPSGDVVVAAQAVNVRGDADYLTVCVDSTGALRWAAGYERGSGFDDWVSAVAVSPAGDVSVTGLSTNHTISHQTVTITYSPSGLQRWLAEYVAPNNGMLFPLAVAADSYGNVIITGQHESGGNGDLATLAYDSAGRQRWIDLYDGPAGDYDGGRDISITPHGMIYVAGESRGTGAVWGAQDDFVVIRFAMDGTRRWIRRYNGPADGYDQHTRCAFDKQMHITITGRSERANEDYDIAAVRYDSLGTEQWVARFNGDGSSRDIPSAISTDAAGNVYMLMSSSGAGSWTDMALCKFNRSGVRQWSNGFGLKPGGYDWFRFLAIDGEGSSIVCGESDAPDSRGRAIVTIKYDSAGNPRWIRTYDSPANGWSLPTGMQVDRLGNIVVAGETSSSPLLIIKYDANGNDIWNSTLTANGGSAIGPVIDNGGNAYSVLRRDGAQGGITVAKHSAHGDLQWTADWRLSDGSIYPYHLAVDRFGFVFVLSRLRKPASPDAIVLSKFNPLGHVVWSITEEPPTGATWGYSLTMNADGDGACVAAAATWPAPSEATNLELIRFDTDGRRRWRRASTLGGDPRTLMLRSSSDSGFDLVATPSGRSIAVLRFASDGQRRMAHSLPLSDFNADFEHLSVSPFGEIILAGTLGGRWWAVPIVLYVGGVPLAERPHVPIAPGMVRLAQNFPNPFNHSTVIHFELPSPGHTTIGVYNILGQSVAWLVDGFLPGGEHTAVWNAGGLSNGVYLIMVRSAEGREVKKAVLIR